MKGVVAKLIRYEAQEDRRDCSVSIAGWDDAPIKKASRLVWEKLLPKGSKCRRWRFEKVRRGHSRLKKRISWLG